MSNFVPHFTGYVITYLCWCWSLTRLVRGAYAWRFLTWKDQQRRKAFQERIAGLYEKHLPVYGGSPSQSDWNVELWYWYHFNISVYIACKSPIQILYLKIKQWQTCFIFFTRGQFWPSDLCVSVCLSVCVCMRQMLIWPWMEHLSIEKTLKRTFCGVPPSDLSRNMGINHQGVRTWSYDANPSSRRK